MNKERVISPLITVDDDVIVRRDLIEFIYTPFFGRSRTVVGYVDEVGENYMWIGRELIRPRESVFEYREIADVKKYRRKRMRHVQKLRGERPLSY